MGYLNPIEAMGLPELLQQKVEDGTIIVNLPPEEASELGPIFEEHDISPHFSANDDR